VRWVIAVAFFALAIGTPRSWRRVWRSDKNDPRWSQRGFASAVFTSLFGRNFAIVSRREGIPNAIGVFAIGLFVTDVEALWLPAVCLLVAGVFLWISIYFFNRPRFLIPPPLRLEAGAVGRVVERRRGSREP